MQKNISTVVSIVVGVLVVAGLIVWYATRSMTGAVPMATQPSTTPAVTTSNVPAGGSPTTAAPNPSQTALQSVAPTTGTLAPTDSATVCAYIQSHDVPSKGSIQFNKCSNYVCSASDGGPDWSVSYRCPASASSPNGADYGLDVNKSNDAITILFGN